MNILYLIGNGFDLAQKLKTSYQDFYQYMLEQKPINAVEARMLEQIKGEDHEKWSDLELALGQFTKDITNKEEFEDFYYDLCDKLRTYLIEQVNDFSVSEQLVDKYIKDLVRPDFYLNRREQLLYENFVRSYSGTRYISVVSFNYTDVIDKCIDVYNSDRPIPTEGRPYKLNPIIKIHGTLGTPYLLMGVNDPQQISNLDFADDEDVLDYLVKPRSNFELGTRIEETVKNHIESAHLIVIMGLSFGETDSVWWETIGNRLKSSEKLYVLIFSHEKGLPRDERRIIRIKRSKRKEFLSKCGIEDALQSKYENQIIVCINSGLFSPSNTIFQDDRKGV